jgi:hypothetical protein
VASTVTLHNGETITTAEDPRALAERFNASRRDGTLIKLVTDGDSPVWVNPHALATIAPS